MVIGIITAVKDETEAIKNEMTNISEKEIYNLKFIEGILSKKDCVLVECGVGKVNAARVTQILIDNFNPDYVINVGSAGSLTQELKIEDIVIGKELVQHDFDVTGGGNYELRRNLQSRKIFQIR